ncbi:hypothetical protein LTR94_033398, partial [Friedmanniomyces endolithicus]
RDRPHRRISRHRAGAARARYRTPRLSRTLARTRHRPPPDRPARTGGLRLGCGAAPDPGRPYQRRAARIDHAQVAVRRRRSATGRSGHPAPPRQRLRRLLRRAIPCPPRQDRPLFRFGGARRGAQRSLGRIRPRRTGRPRRAGG